MVEVDTTVTNLDISRVSLVQPGGATEILQGLQVALDERQNGHNGAKRERGEEREDRDADDNPQHGDNAYYCADGQAQVMTQAL